MCDKIHTAANSLEYKILSNCCLYWADVSLQHLDFIQNFYQLECFTMNPSLGWTFRSVWSTIRKCFWMLWIMWITSMSCTKNVVKITLDKRISLTYQQCTRVTQQRALCIQYTRVINPNALALATSTRSAVNHQHDQIHKYHSCALLRIADKVWSFITLAKTITWKCRNMQQLGLCHRGKRSGIRL